MLNKEQADAVANAVLAPYRQAQEETRQIQTEQRRKREILQKRGKFGLIGFAIGCCVGYLAFGHVYQIGFAGLLTGWVFSYLFHVRDNK